jgi:hypothetical protein
MSKRLPPTDLRLTEEDLTDHYEQAPCGYCTALPDGTLVRLNGTLLVLAHELGVGLGKLGAVFLGQGVGAAQLLLVAVALGDVEKGETHHQRLASGVAQQAGTQQHGPGAAVLVAQLVAEFADLALQQQQRQRVRLVVQPPTHG